MNQIIEAPAVSDKINKVKKGVFVTLALDVASPGLASL